MKIITILIIIFSSTFFSCKKKQTTPVTVLVDETNPEDYIYGRFYANITTIKTQSIIPFFQPVNYFISYYVTFPKVPENDLPVLPQIFTITINNQALSKSPNSYDYYSQYTLSDNQNQPNPALHDFGHINFAFYSKQLGGGNQISEIDSIAPTYTLSFNDTLYLDRNVINTFTINNTTTNFGCALENDFLNIYVPQGVTTIKIYPSQIKNLTIGTIDNLDVNFIKQKKINSLGRNYLLNVNITDTYPIKITG